MQLVEAACNYSKKQLFVFTELLNPSQAA